jgi:ribosomal protein L37AE/L43A
MAQQLEAYPCRYCQKYFCEGIKELYVRSDYDGRMDTEIVCDKCHADIAGGAHRLNAEGLATVIHRWAE